MSCEYPNIYKKARQSTLLTQESAAEILGLSAESMKQYELGKRRPPDAVVSRMVELYGTPWLAFAHSKATDALGVLPETELQPLPSAVLGLIDRCLALSDDYRQLIAIAADGIVDEAERPAYDQIAARVRDVVGACFQVLYAEGTDAKKERPEAATSKRSSQGLQSKPNQQKYYTTGFACNSSPNFAGTGGELL